MRLKERLSAAISQLAKRWTFRCPFKVSGNRPFQIKVQTNRKYRNVRATPIVLLFPITLEGQRKQLISAGSKTPAESALFNSQPKAAFSASLSLA
jgi:hypothetical protein